VRSAKLKKEMVVAFDIRAAISTLEAMGVSADDVEHIVEISDFVATDLAAALDKLVEKRMNEGLCMHPESICLAVAVLAERFVRARLEGSGEKVLDPIACIEVVRKFTDVEIEEDEIDDSETETPRPVTVH
jgi:hypothetical protein